MKTKYWKYTHTGVVVGAQAKNAKVSYLADLRRVGKWWETRQMCRRFDKDGLEKGHWDMVKWGYGGGDWKLKIETVKKKR